MLSLLPSIFFLHSTKQYNPLALQHLSAILQQMHTTQSMGFSGIYIAPCYYDSPNLFLSVLLPVNGCHFLRAQFIPQLNSTQQMNNPFACVAFNFGLNRDLYMVSLYTRGKETPRQNAVCKSESCRDELGPLNLQANVHQNAEYLIAVISMILLFTPCVATAEGICSRVAVSS